jgi:hypothetical protein
MNEMKRRNEIKQGRTKESVKYTIKEGGALLARSYSGLNLNF